jgi:16S rRNA (guanine527-N7)-methyltransferase
MNLTGLSSRERILSELVLDSLIPLPLVPDEGELLDVGAGGGFPGVPIKICRPRLKVHLLEARSKKVTFLKQVVRLTGISPIQIDQGRIERDDHLLCPNGYDVITTRGLGKLPQVLRWCAPHLKKGGTLLNFQGHRYQDALEASRSVLESCGLALKDTFAYTLPGMSSPRHLLVLGRIEPPP